MAASTDHHVGAGQLAAVALVAPEMRWFGQGMDAKAVLHKERFG